MSFVTRLSGGGARQAGDLRKPKSRLRSHVSPWRLRDDGGLVDTGAWADEKSAARYEHVVATKEARRADLLPV